MNKQSEDKATSLQDEPNKLNPAKDEISEQELDKASGGSKWIEIYSVRKAGGDASSGGTPL